MFMADVAVGNAFKTYEFRLDPDNNECPPPGYDAVMGEVGGMSSFATAVSLNFCTSRCSSSFIFFTFSLPL